MTLFNVKQYNFNDATGETSFHNIAGLVSSLEAQKIITKAMFEFSDYGWYIKFRDEKHLEVTKGDERIKIVIKGY